MLNSLIFLISLSWSMPVIHDGFGSSKDRLYPSVISEREADELFKKFKDLDYMAYDYAPGCCYARAMLLSRMADTMNLNMAKVFIEGHLGARLPDSKYDPAEFNWHVAPVLYVKAGNKTELMAFDPAFFDKPVTIEMFKNRFTDKIIGRGEKEVKEVYFGSKFQNKKRTEEKQKISYHTEDFKVNRDDLKKCLDTAREGKVTPLQLNKIENHSTLGSQR